MGLKMAVIRWVLIGIAAFGLGTATADDVYARTIICGKNLCTVGDQPNWDRMCWEVKNKKKNKCSYYCQGVNEIPRDCRNEDKYECKGTPNSRKNCELENNGYPIDPRNKPEKYKYYTEASYSKYELARLPDCKSGKAGEQVCKCFNKIVRQKGQACRKTEMIQTHQENGTGTLVDYTCEYLNDATNSNMTARNSVLATDGYEAQKQIDANTDSLSGDNGCKTIAQYLESYTSGCWSCMVVGALTKAFLNAAQVGIEVTKDAGKKLLILGFAIWLAFWALKNVSSFTEIKGGNVLNDLLKTAAKVVLAWICINAGVLAINKYIVTPIMGIGSEIAQVFWKENNTSLSPSGSNIKEGMEDFEWEEITEEDEKKMLEFMATIPDPEYTPVSSAEVSNSSEMTDEERQAYEENQENFEKFEIPNFLIPGFVGGYITSGAGCRPREATNGQGSICHHGVDGGGFSEGNSQYLAAAAGIIGYSSGSGFGNYAVINHGKKGKYTWKTLYAHMKAYSGVSGRVNQSQPIGKIGNTGHSTGTHIHFEIRANDEAVDPLALAGGKIVFMKDICPKCNGNNRVISDAAKEFLHENGCKPGYKDWGTCPKIPHNGWSPNGVDVVIPSSYTTSSDGGAYEYVVKIPYTEFTGSSAIMPKSVLNSMLWATKVITDNTAQMMVLGNMAMCYSTMKGGGAWTILKLGKVHISITNIFMWLDGAIIWLLGFVLTCIIAYYLVDMSFKIGLAVLAFPLMMGLWPFKVTQGKLAETIAIIAKSAATFAFLAITTYYAIELLAASLGGNDGLQGIYNEYDSIVNNTVQGDERDEIIDRLDNYFHLFSAGFLLMLFGCVYGYKLIRKTTDDLANKFYSDSTFGSQTPMHNRMTGMAAMANKLNQKWGTGLAKDMAANKVGQGLKNVAGRGVTAAKSAGRSVAGGVRSTANKLLGKDGS